MKIDQWKKRSALRPDEGVRFTKAEDQRAREIARSLETLDYDTLNTIRRAVARDAIHLDELVEWTTGELEDERRSRHEAALVMHRAVEMAIARERVSGVYQ